jgi:hypothetical protein
MNHKISILQKIGSFQVFEKGIRGHLIKKRSGGVPFSLHYSPWRRFFFKNEVLEIRI